ncbi:hypothetical protein [Rhizobium sp. BK176]|uniref:hypothetical protein n=1 Tax=Rhizobium sp. BK176 TaxID=2587071 RepID=UPI002167E915|nr:hypothetical protein [Rhizobium sp. BK176]MCS4089253.1 hypothetical protein [Rhizobium sp. BK176]
MAKFQFSSEDGYSRVSAGELQGIIEHGGFDEEVSSVLTSLCHPYFTDYLWIAGEDREYFAEIFEKALKAGHEQSFGMYEKVVKSDEHIKSRWPSLAAVASHLRADDQKIIVITYDVSGCFPNSSFAPKAWKSANRPHAEDVFEELPEAEQWSLTLCNLLKKHPKNQWKRGFSHYASKKLKEQNAIGIGNKLATDSIIRSEIIAARDLPALETALSKLGEELLERAGDHIDPDDTIYIAGNRVDNKFLADPLGEAYLGQCRGAMMFRTDICDGMLPNMFALATEIECWIEPDCPVSKLVIVQAVVSRADEITRAIEMVQRRGQKFDDVLLLTGVINKMQLAKIKNLYPDIEVESVEITKGNLREVHEHMEEVCEAEGKPKRVRSGIIRRFVRQDIEREKAVT